MALVLPFAFPHVAGRPLFGGPVPASPNSGRTGPLSITARRRPPRTESAKVRNLRAIRLGKGTSTKPRLLVFCSGKHLYAQIIDDTKKATLLSTCTAQIYFTKTVEGSLSPILDAAREVGENVAKECLKQGITEVIYYRMGTAHSKRAAAFRHGAQDSGLEMEFLD